MDKQLEMRDRQCANQFHHVQSEISELRQSLATVQVSLLSAVDAITSVINASIGNKRPFEAMNNSTGSHPQ